MNTSQSDYGLLKPALCFALVIMSSSSMQLQADQIPKTVTPQLIPTDFPWASQRPYQVVVAPNPKLEFMTMGIVPTLSKPKGASAISLAYYVSQSIHKRRGQRLGIFVFNDLKTAKLFKSFQSGRQGRPLKEVDFVSLKAVPASVVGARASRPH